MLIGFPSSRTLITTDEVESDLLQYNIMNYAYMHNHHTESFALLCTNYSVYLMGTTVINIIAPVGGEGLAWVRGYSMCTRVCAQTLDKAG